MGYQDPYCSSIHGYINKRWDIRILTVLQFMDISTIDRILGFVLFFNSLIYQQQIGYQDPYCSTIHGYINKRQIIRILSVLQFMDISTIDRILGSVLFFNTQIYQQQIGYQDPNCSSIHVYINNRQDIRIRNVLQFMNIFFFIRHTHPKLKNMSNAKIKHSEVHDVS